MAVPQVVIVGRPNVGKSSLLNWLSGLRLAIVEDQPGITRDRVDYLMEHDDRFFELVDTGGIGVNDIDNLTQHIEEQIQVAIDAASVILFVVDTRQGLLPLDEEVARRIRHVDVPVICIANKSDSNQLDEQSADFYRLGRGKIVPVSTTQNRNRAVLLNMIVERLPAQVAENGDAPNQEPEMKVAIVGRRNVGKSTFVNTLAQAARMIVSRSFQAQPETVSTCDSNWTEKVLSPSTHLAFDVPRGGRRRRSTFTDFIEPQRSIRRADVVFLFLDATQRISKVDKQLCDYISQNYKPCMLVVNKWGSPDRLDAHRKVGALSARHVSYYAVRTDRIHYRRIWQERQGAPEPRTNAFQAVATAGSNRTAESTAPRCDTSHTPHPSFAIDDRRSTMARRSEFSPLRWCCFAMSRGRSHAPTSATSLGRSATSSALMKYRSSSIYAKDNRVTDAMKSMLKIPSLNTMC